MLSLIYLMICFMLYRKNDKKICFLSSLVYSLGLLLCYNTFIVFFLYLIGMSGSLLLYGIINVVIGSIILILSLCKKKDRIQRYSFDKKNSVVILGLIILVFLVGCFRFRGFEAISYESGDSAIHYRHAVKFSDNLSILDKNNNDDRIFNHFVRVMPISYINCGFLFRMFPKIDMYKLYLYFNVFVLVLSSLVFFVTIMNVIKNKKNGYGYALILSLFYTLGFPFNNMIMGFGYLSLSIIVINLLYLTIFEFNGNFDKNIVYKIIVIFLLTFSCFYSYYLFMPVIYLSLGLYYIMMYKKKKISLKQMFLYGGVTLIIPFVIGFCYFILSLFFEGKGEHLVNLIGTWGYSYTNILPMYFFIGLTAYFVYLIKKKDKVDYLKLNIYSITVFIGLFLILYVAKFADAYYFFKWFSLYWLLMLIYFVNKIERFKKIFYGIVLVLGVFNIFVYMNPASSFGMVAMRTNIFSWNSFMLNDGREIYNKDELDLFSNSMKYKEDCTYDGRFLMSGEPAKNVWFYTLSDLVPVYFDADGDWTKLNVDSAIEINNWYDMLDDYKCLIYYYEGRNPEIDNDKYDVLYENNSGLLVRRKY